MSLFLLIALAAPPDPTADAGLLPAELRWAAVAGCVRVVDDEGRPAGSAACVGYRDGHAYLLTAEHAVPRGAGRAFEFFTRKSYPRPARTAVGGDVVLRLPDADVAVVKVLVPDAPAVLRLAGPGQRPKRFPFAAVAVGCPAGSPPACRAETVTGKKLVRRPGGGVAFFWEAAGQPVGGMSGGPLLDSEGRVIGVCAATQEGRGYYGHLDEVLAGLKGAKLGWLAELP